MLAYVNKISIIIFIGISFFFFLELINFFKIYKRKKIKLPGFSEKEYKKKTLHKANVVEEKKKVIGKANFKLVILGVGIFIIIVIFSLISLTSTRRSSAKEEDRPAIKQVFSKGIVIFDKNWNLINDSSKLKPGEKVYIGIYKPNLEEIDKARIKVNEYNWKKVHVTEKFNKEKKVFYIEYKIPSDATKLSIEAQLHSKVEGWLTD